MASESQWSSSCELKLKVDLDAPGLRLSESSSMDLLPKALQAEASFLPGPCNPKPFNSPKP